MNVRSNCQHYSLFQCELSGEGRGEGVILIFSIEGGVGVNQNNMFILYFNYCVVVWSRRREEIKIN